MWCVSVIVLCAVLVAALGRVPTKREPVCAEDPASAERGLMARELHDIVSHGLALILVRAGVARTLADPRQTSEAMEVIEQAARDSLTEMRHMLAVLRPPHEADWAPQPDLRSLDELMAAARAAGSPVELVRVGTPHGLHACHEVTVYRIVQEALSNMDQTGATVTVEFRADRLIVDVVTEAGELPRPRLAGIGERVTLQGGSLSANQDGGGFRLVATLPLRR